MSKIIFKNKKHELGGVLVTKTDPYISLYLLDHGRGRTCKHASVTYTTGYCIYSITYQFENTND
jgi:hypothetical protein